MNDAINGSKEPVYIGIYDIDKCFDSLWLDECINDMFEAGLQNTKLNLLLGHPRRGGLYRSARHTVPVSIV